MYRGHHGALILGCAHLGWLAFICTYSTFITPEAAHARQASVHALKFRAGCVGAIHPCTQLLESGTTHPRIPMLDAQLDACSSNRWLFVYSAGGRTGSTTIMSMLNAVPSISITGENGGLLGKLNKLRHDTMLLRQPDPYHAWHNMPNATALRAAVCQWLLALSPQPSALVHGYKETRIDSAAAVVRALPSARFVLSYRENATAQVRSIGSIRHWGSGPGVTPAQAARAETFKHDEGASSRAVHQLRTTLPKSATFSLPLERFDLAAFNALLRWLGVTGCHYMQVLHTNLQYLGDRHVAHGLKTCSRSVGDPASPLLSGACQLTPDAWDRAAMRASPSEPSAMAPQPHPQPGRAQEHASARAPESDEPRGGATALAALAAVSAAASSTAASTASSASSTGRDTGAPWPRVLVRAVGRPSSSPRSSPVPLVASMRSHAALTEEAIRVLGLPCRQGSGRLFTPLGDELLATEVDSDWR